MTTPGVDDFGVQVLYALFQSALASTEIYDEDVWEQGQELFGIDWGGAQKYSFRLDHHYYPVIAMKLGQLVKLGYVSKVPLGDTFVAWKVTNAGKQTLTEHNMFGDELTSPQNE